MSHPRVSREQREYQEAQVSGPARPSGSSADNQSGNPRGDITGNCFSMANERSGPHSPIASTSQPTPQKALPQNSPRMALGNTAGFVPVNRPSVARSSVPAEARVAGIPSYSSPSRRTPQSRAKRGSGNSNESSELSDPVSMPTPKGLSTIDRDPHTTFKAIKIHTAKCDVCNNHNKCTLHRCMDCGWQICTPCWHARGGGTHGPTRRFTGPVFGETVEESSQEKDTARDNESDTTLSYVEESSEKEVAEPRHPSTRGRAKTTINDDEDPFVSLSTPSTRNNTVIGNRNRYPVRNSRSGVVLTPNNKSDGAELVAGHRIYRQRRFRDLTPNTERRMNYLLIAAERILGDKKDEDPQLFRTSKHRYSSHDVSARRSPLFVPMEIETTNTSRNRPIYPPIPTIRKECENPSQIAARFQEAVQLAPAQKRPFTEMTLPSPSSDEVAGFMASIPGRNMEFSTGSPRPVKRRNIGPKLPAPWATPSSGMDPSSDSSGAVDPVCRPESGTNPHGRAWEL